ncbi:MAG TPA: hypothetical protein PLI30_08500 [Petrimonas sp.]|nr:hypothetical protein [Petrimonas sp.]
MNNRQPDSVSERKAGRKTADNNLDKQQNGAKGNLCFFSIISP